VATSAPCFFKGAFKMPVSPDILIVEDGSIVADANSYVSYD
jgi:hypothetical protein